MEDSDKCYSVSNNWLFSFLTTLLKNKHLFWMAVWFLLVFVCVAPCSCNIPGINQGLSLKDRKMKHNTQGGKRLSHCKACATQHLYKHTETQICMYTNTHLYVCVHVCKNPIDHWSMDSCCDILRQCYFNIMHLIEKMLHCVS